MTEQELGSFWDLCDAQLKDMGAANSNNFDELAKHSFLPFIGAGMSAGFGYPVWTAFLRQEIRGYAPKEKQAELQKMLKEKQFLPLANALDQCTNLLSASAEGREEASCPLLAAAIFYLSDSADGRQEAEALYRESLELRKNLAKVNPSVYEPYVAMTCNNLADLLAEIPGRDKEAEALYQEALALRRKQVRIAPEVYGPNLARVCRNLGRFLQSQGRTEEAEALFQEAKGE